MSEMAETEQSIALRLEEMIEVQNRTKHTMELLIRRFADLSARLDGDREDVAAATIHDLLEHDFDWKVDELGRNWQKWEGTDEEIVAFGQAHNPTRPEISLWIVGEMKFNLTMRDVERFALLLERTAKQFGRRNRPRLFQLPCASCRVRGGEGRRLSPRSFQRA